MFVRAHWDIAVFGWPMFTCSCWIKENNKNPVLRKSDYRQIKNNTQFNTFKTIY